jgi:hypothetical protein
VPISCRHRRRLINAKRRRCVQSAEIRTGGGAKPGRANANPRRATLDHANLGRANLGLANLGLANAKPGSSRPARARLARRGPLQQLSASLPSD